MNRSDSVLLAAMVALAACFDDSTGLQPSVAVAPVLDSLFEGDSAGPFGVTYYDANGNPQPAGPVVWSTTDAAVLSVDSGTGKIVAVGPGVALLSATARGVTGHALLVVSRTLQVD